MNPFDLFKQAHKFQDALKDIQAELSNIEVIGESGAGMVKVVMNCRYTVLNVHLETELLSEDPKVIQQLIQAAMQDALSKVEETARTKMREILTKMGLPANLNLPFMPGF